MLQIAERLDGAEDGARLVLVSRAEEFRREEQRQARRLSPVADAAESAMKCSEAFQVVFIFILVFAFCRRRALRIGCGRPLQASGEKRHVPRQTRRTRQRGGTLEAIPVGVHVVVGAVGSFPQQPGVDAFMSVLEPDVVDARATVGPGVALRSVVPFRADGHAGEAPRFKSLAQGFQRRAPFRRDGVGGEKESVGRRGKGGEEGEEGNGKFHGEIMIEVGSFVKGKR